MPSNIHSSISGKARESLARILDHVLQEECFLLATTREYRGKVTGPNLYSLHRLFDEQRRQLDYWLERLLERTRSIGLLKRRWSRELALSESKSRKGGGLPAGRMISELLSQHERIAHELREEIDRLRDPATADLLQGLLEFHETTAWMLRVVHNGADTDPSET